MRNVFTSLLSLFALVVRVTMVILRILFIHVHTDIHEWNIGMQQNMTLVSLSTIHQLCQCTEMSPQETTRVIFIPEGFVAELAGVRQTSTSFLLTAGCHAEVAAAIGHL